MVLCGVRDVRDYRIHSGSANTAVAGGSAFNVKAKSLRLGDFSRDDVLALLGQHTAETGQAFTAGALDLVWERTQGQPWLVNALADDACFEDKAGRDRSRPIDAEAVLAAQERLILRRETHLDQLADKLQEERVRRVVEPLLSGGAESGFKARDLEYVRDLGLIAVDDPPRVANPIYAEVVPRELTYAVQVGLTEEMAWYVDADGGLDVRKLLSAFQTFFREHSEHWSQRFQYQEAWPQLLLQAFLQRVVNGGGRVEREYGLGRGRTDLLIVWPRAGGGLAPGASRAGGSSPGAEEAAGHVARVDSGDRDAARAPRARAAEAPGQVARVDKVVIECKVLRGSLERTVADCAGRQGRDRVQGAAREPGADSRRGAGADGGVHGPVRGAGRSPGDRRPHGGAAVGREGVPPADDVAGRRRHRRVGHVTTGRRVVVSPAEKLAGSAAFRPADPVPGARLPPRHCPRWGSVSFRRGHAVPGARLPPRHCPGS